MRLFSLTVHCYCTESVRDFCIFILYPEFIDEFYWTHDELYWTHWWALIVFWWCLWNCLWKTCHLQTVTILLLPFQFGFFFFCLTTLQCGRPGFDPWVGKIPWRRERLPTPVFWPEELQGLYSPWGHTESDTTEWLSLSLWLELPIACWIKVVRVKILILFLILEEMFSVFHHWVWC